VPGGGDRFEGVDLSKVQLSAVDGVERRLEA
jgi:hypothetical protein